MARLKFSITATLGMALLTLASRAHTTPKDDMVSMFKSFFPEKCAECFETNLAICGEMRPDDIKYATCLCASDARDTVDALLLCADICVPDSDRSRDDSSDAMDPYRADETVVPSLADYCYDSLPVWACKDATEGLNTGSIWEMQCVVNGWHKEGLRESSMEADRNRPISHDLPRATTGPEDGSAVRTLFTNTEEGNTWPTAMPTLTRGRGNTELDEGSVVRTLFTNTDKGSTWPTAMPTLTRGRENTQLSATTTDSGSTHPNTSTAGGVMEIPMARWGAVAALGVIAAMV